MKYAMLGLVALAALFAGVAYSGQAVKAAEEIRLRANLSDPVIDPFSLNIAEFRQRPDHNRFRVEVHQLAEIGTGKVIVKRDAGVTLPVVIILEAPIAIGVDPLRGMGTGILSLDSRLGDDVPLMIVGDLVDVHDATGQLIRSGTLKERI